MDLFVYKPGLAEHFGPELPDSIRQGQRPTGMAATRERFLHCLGSDHTRLNLKFQGRHHRLTDVQGSVVKIILA